MSRTDDELYELIRPMIDGAAAPDDLVWTIISVIKEERRAVARQIGGLDGA